MTIDFWGLGLQAINVLILVWLLSRVFWRPVSDAIEQREKENRAIIESGKAAQIKSEAILAELTQARASIATERNTLLTAAKIEADKNTKTILAKAQRNAETILATAHVSINRDTQIAQKTNAAKATELALQVAARLLEQLNSPTVQKAFLTQLLVAINQLPDADLKALSSSPDGIKLISACAPGTEREEVETSIRNALGNMAPLHWVNEPELIAGLELHSPHFVLRNSWQSDLAEIRKAISHAS